jgi:hypothetical protein
VDDRSHDRGVTASERRVALEDLPEAVQEAVREHTKGLEYATGKVVEDEKVEAVTKGGITVYEAQVKKDGKKSEVVVGADGTIQKQ